MNPTADFNGIRGIAFDLDGTLYLSDRLLEGASEAIAFIRRRGIRAVFISNKPLDTCDAYARKLARLGIPCDAQDVINSSLVCARYLQRHRPESRVFVIGERPIRTELEAHGLRLTDDPARVDVVVLSLDRNFHYRMLQTAYEAVRRGAEVVATNPDRVCPMEGFELPDCACLIAALEACTGRPVQTVVGKPSMIMLDEMRRLLDFEPAACAVVGDRLETDMAMARSAGMLGILVLTGVTDRQTLAGWREPPEVVLDSVADLPALFSD